jgi:hypothetical protein
MPGAAVPRPGDVSSKVEASLGSGVSATPAGLGRVETEDSERLTPHGPDFR